MGPANDYSITIDDDPETAEDEEVDRNRNRNSNRSNIHHDNNNGDDIESASEEQIVVEESRESIWREIFIFFSCFFLVIATVLGTGVLALPVKVYNSGFWPFFSTFAICLIMQSFILLYMIELLQRAQVIQQEMEKKENEKSPEDSQTTLVDSSDRAASNSNKLMSKGPDLHLMGNLFLNRWLQIIFDAAVILHFVSILISYALAGPQAYGQLMNINFKYLISPFIIVLALIVIFGRSLIASIISSITLIKGLLLLIMVGMIGFVGAAVQQSSNNEWGYIGEPFLIGTVALGGAINVLPVVYASMRPTARNIRIFQFGAIAGITTCWILNVLWCLFILMIVPQESDDLEAPTLERAQRQQEISTVPLIEVIKQKYPKFDWIGTVTNVFIMLSVTVSFMTLSSGMKHMLDGYAKAFHQAALRSGSRVQRFSQRVLGRVVSNPQHQAFILQILLYLICFVSVDVIAQFNPKSFLKVMETFTSFALNLEAGVFIAVMLYKACGRTFSHLEIPLPLPKYIIKTFYVVALYFLFAMVYDIVIFCISIFSDSNLKPEE